MGLEGCRVETRADMHKILDCFSGADGSYVMVQSLVVEMDKRAAGGDKAAAQIVSVVHRFADLIRAADRLAKESRR